jgi:hypothetical protein
MTSVSIIDMSSRMNVLAWLSRLRRRVGRAHAHALQGLKTLISRSRLDLLDLRGCSQQRSTEQELARMSTAYSQILV